MERDEIGALQKLFQTGQVDAQSLRRCPIRRAAPGEDRHAECGGSPCYRLTDASETHNAKRLAREPPERSAGPVTCRQVPFRPSSAVDKSVVVENPAIPAQNEGQRV